MPPSPAHTDWNALWDAVQKQFKGSVYGIHSIDHWRRVERNTLTLAKAARLSAEETNAVRLFAVLHDSQRVNDNWDPQHGERAAVYARQIRGTLFEISDELMKKLVTACERHDKGQVTQDPVIGCCWDADRIDLTRLSVVPRESLMSTVEGKRIAQALGGRISSAATPARPPARWPVR